MLRVLLNPVRGSPRYSPKRWTVLCEGGGFGSYVLSSGRLDLGAAHPKVKCKYSARSSQSCTEHGCVPESCTSISSNIVEDDWDEKVVTGVKQCCRPQTI